MKRTVYMKAPTSGDSVSLISRLRRRLGAALAAMVAGWRRRRMLAELARFDDRMLRDIGLQRGDLRDAAALPLWRDRGALLVQRAYERRSARARVAPIHEPAPRLEKKRAARSETEHRSKRAECPDHIAVLSH